MTAGGRPLLDELRLRARLMVGAVGAGLLITVLVGGTILGVLAPRVDRNLRFASALRVGHEAMLDQETGLRAYLATGDATFLPPYEAGRRHLAGVNAQLDRLIASDASLAPGILRVRLAQQAWEREWAAPVAAGGRAGEGADLAVKLAAGKVRFDEYRSAYDATIAEVLVRRQKALDAERLVILVGLVAQGVVLLGAIGLEIRQRRQLAARLVAPMDDLVATMERVESGDLTARPAGTGPPELRRVGRGLGDMVAAVESAQARLQAAEEAASALAAHLELVLEAARDIAGSLNLRYVCEAITTAARRIGSADHAAIWLAPKDELDVLVLTYDDRLDRHAPMPEDVLALGIGPIGEAARDARSRFHDGELALPFVVGGRVIGVLDVRGVGDATPAQVITALETLAIQGAAALESARLHEHTADLAVHDPLTGLGNRRMLERDLGDELARSVRYERPLAFVMADVDHFKALNDRFGHQAGDVALEAIAATMRAGVRGSDTVYRYGGEELCVLVREGTVTDAAALAERLRHAVAASVRAPDGGPITASFGVAGMAALAGDQPGGAAMVAAADRALYEAKQGGRNRVAIAGVSAGAG